MKNKVENEQKKVLVECLGFGAENAISRRDLSDILGIEDRQTRMLIHTLRKEGLTILSSNRVSGYFLPSRDPGQAYEEVKAYVEENQSRMLKTAHATKSAKQWLMLFEIGGDSRKFKEDFVV